MQKNISLFLITACLIGCSNMPDKRDGYINWRSDIKREGQIVELMFDKHHTQLTSDHKSDLQKQLNHFNTLDHVRARVFSDTAESETLSKTQQARLNKVKTYLAHKGISTKHIKFYRWKESRFGQIRENSIMITFDTNTIAPDKCPDWNTAINHDETPDGTTDFGCANAYNHAVLVADKSDLIEGKTLRNRDSSMKLNAVKNYQKDKTKELKNIKSSTADNSGSN